MSSFRFGKRNIVSHNERSNLYNLLICVICSIICLLAFTSMSYSFLDNFERKDFGDDWRKSPSGQDVAWTIEKGIAAFSGVGGHSQMMTGKSDWKDYAVECDIKLPTLQEWPGGIRTHIDEDTGGHYAVWFYPVQKNIKLYSGTAWDINTGIVTLGEFKPFDPEADTFFHVKVVHSGKSIEVWLGDNKDNIKKIIDASDDSFKSGPFALDGWDKPIHFDNVPDNRFWYSAFSGRGSGSS